MLTHMSSNDTRIKIVAATRRVPDDDTNSFAIVEFIGRSVCDRWQKSKCRSILRLQISIA